MNYLFGGKPLVKAGIDALIDTFNQLKHTIEKMNNYQAQSCICVCLEKDTRCENEDTKLEFISFEDSFVCRH
jgi:hypoxanthine-guanine phosphoribosyltransferase